MSRFRATSIAVALCVSVTAGLASSNPADASTVTTHRSFYAYPDYSRVVNYMEAVVQNQIVAAVYEIGLYVTGMEAERAAQAERDRIAAYVRSQYRPPAPAPRANPPAPAPRPSAPSGGGVGSCTGFAIPDYIIQRESGGNPSAVNPSSGAYGCAQVMPYVWNANCSDLSRDVNGQRECVNRLSNGGTNLQPWATTR